MKIKDVVGIDMSKLTFDARLHKSQAYQEFENSKQGFAKCVKWVYKNSEFEKENILFSFEHTGLYSHQLALFLTKKEIPFSMFPGLEIRRSLGIARGKDDKIDATKIALYAYRLRDEIKTYKMPEKVIQSLKRLITLRQRLVKQRSGYKASLSEQKRVLVKKEEKKLFEIQERLIRYFTKQIVAAEKQMRDLIKNDEELNKQFLLINSIKGVGNVTAYFMIAYTYGFTKFATWRKFASYCGTAPFPNKSGTSIRGKTKVSHLANKKAKTLLDLCAKSALQHNPEMKIYYKRRLEAGKKEMETINVIRNKLLARMFAVIKRGTPYVDMTKYAA